MKSAKLCQLHKRFESAWEREFPKDPIPVLKGIDDVIKEGLSDEAVLRIFIAAVRDKLVATEANINLFRERILQEFLIKDFLIRMLSICYPVKDFSVFLSKLNSQIAEVGTWKSSYTGSIISNDEQDPKYDIDKVPENSDSDSQSVNFIFKVENNTATFLRSTSPRLCYRSTKKHYYKREDDEDVKAKDSYCVNNNNNLGELSELEEMFGRKKNIISKSKSNEGTSGSYTLGSKDNFLAVSSKHIPPSSIPHRPEVDPNSPQLVKNFHLLKQTKGFDLVLGDSATDDNHNSHYKTDSNICIGSKSGVNNSNSDIAQSEEVVNIESHESHGPPPLSGSHENAATIQIRKTGWKGPDLRAAVVESEVNTHKQTLVEESSSVIVCDTVAKTKEGGRQEIFHEKKDFAFSFQDSLRKFSSKGGVTPPPVAKKPTRGGSGKNLTPVVAVEKPAVDADLANVDIVVGQVGANLVKTQQGFVHFRESGRVVNRSVSVEGVSGIDCGHASETPVKIVTVNNTQEPSESLPGLSRVKFSSHPDLTDDSRNDFTEGNDSRIIIQSKDNTVTEALLLQQRKTDSNIAASHVLADPREVRAVVDTDMSSYRFGKGSDGTDKRNSIGDLVEGVGSSLIGIHKRVEDSSITVKQHEPDSSNCDLSSSKTSNIDHISSRTFNAEAPLSNVSIINISSSNLPHNNDVSPPEIPKKMPIFDYNKAGAILEDVSEIINKADADYLIFVSSNSTESTLIDLDSDENFTSAANATAGTRGQDDAGSSESTDFTECSPKIKKRHSSTPNYENWTLNRAITASNRDFYSVSDDDELDDVLAPPTPVDPNIDQPDFSTGSKDSGLCDDLSPFETPHNDNHGDSGQTEEDTTTADVQLRVKSNAAFENDLYVNIGLKREVGSQNAFVAEPRRGVRKSEEDITENVSADRLSVDTLSVASDGDEEASTNMDSSYDETDSARDNMLNMRQLLVKGVLDSEKGYLKILSLLTDYKRMLEASSLSSQPVISKEDIQTIFSNIETVSLVHREFVDNLQAKVNNWSNEEQIGEIFKIMISKLINFSNYLNNYQQAVSTIHKCSQESEQFADIAKHITVKSTMKEVTSLEDALFKPVQRLQRNTLVLHDLIKYTPTDHPDYIALQKALKLSQQIIENFATSIPQSVSTQENRRLVKSSFLVEEVGGVRKIRYIFLFSDVLVCTKREIHRNNKVSFTIKWFAPLNQSVIDTKFAYNDDNKASRKDEISELKGKLKAQKKELKAEVRKSDDKDRHRTLVSLGGGGTRNVEKLKKKVHQTEALLILASPKLPFKVLIEGGRSYTLLMSTDYEREEWKEAVASQCKRLSRFDPPLHPMSSIYVQELINSVKETPQVNKIGNVLMQKDEDLLTGILNVTIHKVNGLREACDTYCNMEMDSFGHFFFKARTTICEGSQDPAWNEDFDLELEGSETLRILCFKKEPGSQGDTLLGRVALELSKHWLRDSFQEKTLSMNDISLVISVRHIPADKTMQRTPSRTTSALFGVSISSCARREGKTVPTIVTACIQEVEKRGMDEVGIYRVSGVSSDLQSLKRLFDRNVRAGVVSLQDADIHSVTGILKLYFRELPEPLFTEASYHSFIDTLKLSDEEAKTQCMLALLHGLPDTNYYTTVYLLEHLIKVAKNVGVNKMSIQNLSTIFGPTLLAPAAKQVSSNPLEMMCRGAEEAMQHSSIINFLLGLAFSGRSLRRSAQ